MAVDTAATVVKVRAVVEGLPGLNQLKTAMRGISAESKSAGVDLRIVNDQLKSLKGEVNNSVNNLRLQVQAFQAVRNSAQIGSQAYREATLRLKELNRELDKAEGRGGGGGRLASLGAIAGAGFFGGPESMIGAGIGALTGPQGAFAGAAIGAQVAELRKAMTASAEYSQSIAKLNIALKGVVENSNEYAQAQQAIQSVSEQLNVPILEATQGFTRLTAAVIGAGGNVSDAEVVFRGISNAIKATGGSASDVQSALVAMSQVFSKGKVSAEELQGQLGERLPGAVTLFAQATGRTLPQLAKDLEAGTVGLNDLMKFTEELSKRYGTTASQMAKSTEDSGARMTVALEKLGKTFGDFFKPIKVNIDRTIEGLANMVNRFIQAQMLMSAGLRLTQAEKEDVRATAKLMAGRRFPRGGFARAGEEERLYQEMILDRLKSKAYVSGFLQPVAGVTDQARTTFQEPKPSNQRDQSESRLRKLQSDFARSIAVLGRQFNTETRKQLMDEMLGLESQITSALKKGKIEEVDRLRIMQQRRALEITRDVLINEELKLEEKIANASGKNLDLTDARNRLAEIRNEREQTVLGLTRLQNDELAKTVDLVKKIAEKDPTYKGAEVEQILPFGTLRQEIEELKRSLEDIQPRLSQLAGDLSTSFSTAFSNLVFSAQSARESLAQLFQDIAKSFQNMVIQMIADYLKLQIMTFFKNIFAPAPVSVAGNYFSGGAPSMFTNPSFGVGAGNFTGSLLPAFAMGGIMSAGGPMKLKRYAAGGIASSPQLAMFGEGSRPEAYVPLPDGRSIPVKMSGGGTGNIVVNVDASGSSVQGNGPDANALGRAVGAAVQAELIKQKRPGGLLA